MVFLDRTSSLQWQIECMIHVTILSLLLLLLLLLLLVSYTTVDKIVFVVSASHIKADLGNWRLPLPFCIEACCLSISTGGSRFLSATGS